MQGRAPTSAAWTRQQLLVAGAVNLGGLVLVAGGYAGVEAAATLDRQVLWVNLALLGLALALTADGALLVQHRRAIGQRLRRLQEIAPRTDEARAPSADERWLWISGTHRAHRDGCPLVAGKLVERLAGSELEQRALAECEVCAP